MSKTLVYRFFGLGRIPKKILPTLEQEGIVLQDEGLSGSVTLRNFRSPTRRSGWRRSWISGSLAITEQRFWGFSFFRPVVSVPLDSQHFRDLDISIEKGHTLRVEFDAAAYHEGWSGTVICRFRTSKAQLFLERLRPK